MLLIHVSTKYISPLVISVCREVNPSQGCWDSGFPVSQSEKGTHAVDVIFFSGHLLTVPVCAPNYGIEIFYYLYAINNFTSVWECTLPPGIQTWETITLSCLTGKRKKAGGCFFGPFILGVSLWQKTGIQRGGGGREQTICLALKLLTEDLLQTEECRGNGGVLLNCWWSPSSGWFSSA